MKILRDTYMIKIDFTEENIRDYFNFGPNLIYLLQFISQPAGGGSGTKEPEVGYFSFSRESQTGCCLNFFHFIFCRSWILNKTKTSADLFT